MEKEKSIVYFEGLNNELENYFSNTIIPQLFVDFDLIVRKFTPPAMKQFKLVATDIGRSITEIADNIRFPSIIENIRQVIDTGVILEKEIQTTDLRWFQMNILPYLVKPSNTTNGVIITFIDITARINDLKDLESLIAEHQILIDTIAHDIRNPLTNITLAAELIKHAPPASPDVLTGILIIERAVNRVQLMVSDLNSSKREASLKKPEAELLSVEHIIEDVRLTLTKQLQDARAILKSNINVSEINFSRRKLRSIFFNLISNAVKFRSPERRPEIIISTFMESNRLVIAVTDNGLGIPVNKQDAVFAKHCRLHNDIEGTGVGLYLVKEIVQTAGGDIKLDSTPGEGSTFSIFLKIG